MILIGVRDVGPARYLLALGLEGAEVVWVADNPARAELIDAGVDLIDEHQVDEYPITLVITGTSLGNYSDSLDKRLLRWANTTRLKSIAIVEHWTWPVARFMASGKCVLPRMILVNDEIVRREMVAGGISNSIIKEVGNPYLEVISKLNRRVVNKRVGKRIYFISESIRKSVVLGHIEPTGYDEFEILDDLLSVIRLDEKLIIKLHPEEERNKYREIYKGHTNVELVSKGDVTSIVEDAHAIVGMDSMLLLELAMLRSDVISFRKNSRLKFIGEELGAVITVRSARQLRSALDGSTVSPSKFVSRFSGSRTRCLDEINRYYYS